MSAYLTALSMKGETIDEITASAAGMRAHCIKLLHDMDVLEIVGTGGDGSNSFNISTTSSLVIAAGGSSGSKTRKQSCFFKIRRSRRAGSTGREHFHYRSGTKRTAAERHQHMLPVRAELPRSHEIRGTDPKRTGHPDCVQHPRRH